VGLQANTFLGSEPVPPIPSAAGLILLALTVLSGAPRPRVTPVSGLATQENGST